MKKYKLFTIFILVVAMFVFLNQNVYAEMPLACSEDLNNDCYSELFALHYELDQDDEKLTITVGHQYLDQNGDNVVFKITEINGKKYNRKVRYNHPVTVKIKLKSSGNKIKMHTTKNITVVALDGKPKKTGKIYVSMNIDQSMEMSGAASDESGEGPLDGLLELSVGTKEIDCSGVNLNSSNIDEGIFDYNSFEQRFCYAKKAAKYLGGEKNQGTLAQNTDLSGKTFKNNVCRVDAKKITRKFNVSDNASQKEYYQNVNYYYAQSKFKYTKLGRYLNYYSVIKPKKSAQLSCELTCEESVSVAFGPPVAIKAGLCFEYRVKVTSRVYCWVSTPPIKPPHPIGYCTPGPTCYHAGVKYKQGGPTEDFEKCVRECDGGKYTPKCSNTCYERVYGKTLNAAQKTSANLDGSLSKCVSESSYGGCYYRNSLKGAIKWSGRSSGYNVYAPGRWYRNHSWGIAGHHYYVPLNDGFYRAIQDDGGYCHDSCSWGGCAWNKYLNPGQADKDWERNKEIYNQAVRDCQAKASCNTTTTTYEISAAYNRAVDENGNIEKIVVHFPYTGDSDIEKVKSDTPIETTKSPTHPDRLSTCDKTPQTNTYLEAANNSKKKSTIFEYDWCYGSTCPNDRIGYLTAWTFPGSWINRKTGEVTFNPEYNGVEGWREKPGKFCVPKDALSINSYWYQWYFHQVEKTETSKYDGVCLNSTTKEVIQTAKYSDWMQKSKTSVEYNIFAKTTKFGYFKWNFEIKCFFAIDNGDNSDPNGQATTVINSETQELCQPTEYRIRTVTTTDLFPDGKDSAGNTKERYTGYNWTDDAALTQQTLPASYKTLPSKTLATIQSTGNEIYKNPHGDLTKNEYVDYAFTLTPDDLNNIAEYNSKLSSYDVFCGTLLKGDAYANISVYQSNLFRSGQSTNDQAIAACKTAGNNRVKMNTGDKRGTVGVNNQ